MTLLQIVQALHREGGFPGDPPAGVAGLSGRANDLVQWCIAAYNDIQREKAGKWRWLRKAWSLSTTASDIDYAYTEVTDVEDAGAIARFRAWDLDQRDLPHIYLTSDGASTERELSISEWRDFRYRYLRATHDAAYPGELSVDTAGVLYFGPTPDAIYTASGYYWRSNQTLAADGDTPEMPSDYHMLVVFTALEKYAYNVVAREKLARASREGTRLWDALSLDQGYDLFSMTTAGALA